MIDKVVHLQKREYKILILENAIIDLFDGQQEEGLQSFKALIKEVSRNVCGMLILMDLKKDIFDYFDGKKKENDRSFLQRVKRFRIYSEGLALNDDILAVFDGRQIAKQQRFSQLMDELNDISL